MTCCGFIRQLIEKQDTLIKIKNEFIKTQLFYKISFFVSLWDV